MLNATTAYDSQVGWVEIQTDKSSSILVGGSNILTYRWSFPEVLSGKFEAKQGKKIPASNCTTILKSQLNESQEHKNAPRSSLDTIWYTNEY